MEGRFLHPRMSELASLTLLSAARNRLTMLPAGLGLSSLSLSPSPPLSLVLSSFSLSLRA
jgi:hypothetical protein